MDTVPYIKNNLNMYKHIMYFCSYVVYTYTMVNDETFKYFIMYHDLLFLIYENIFKEMKLAISFLCITCLNIFS
jgi:hypothetical protein